MLTPELRSPEAEKIGRSLKSRPKVLMIIATDDIGGAGKLLLQFLNHAPREAFDYVLGNFELKNRPIGQFVQEARRNELNLIFLKQRAVFDPGLLMQARRLVRERGINLVETHGYKGHVIGCFLRLFLGIRWLAFAHGYTAGDWKLRLYNRIDVAVLRHADRIVAVSNSMRALLIKKGISEKKIRLIYNAIDVSDCLPADRRVDPKRAHGITDRTVIGVIGRLSPEKGQIVFLQAMHKAARLCPHVSALIIGDGPDRGVLERYCHENQLSDRVIFTGHQENIDDYYQILDLLVIPSLSEGLPNTVLEAMSFSIPVLATNVGGLPEIVGEDSGILVPPNDPDALAERMVELLRDDRLRRAMGVSGRRSLLPRFSADHRAREIARLYDELLTSSRAAKETTHSHSGVTRNGYPSGSDGHDPSLSDSGHIHSQQ